MPVAAEYDFFLGANTPRGFVSRFDCLGGPGEGWRLWVVKGAPGSGKSTLMKTVREAMRPWCREIHNIHCSSDADSLDAVVFPEHRLAIADGTPPHALEPRFPGAYENVVSLCDCWDKDLLWARREEILALSGDCARRHAAAVAALSAAENLTEEARAVVLPAIDLEKLDRFANVFAARLLPEPGQGAGRETVRLLSAVTNKGQLAFSGTVEKLAKRRWNLRDDWGVAAPVILEAVRQRALAAGLDVIACGCPMAPRERLDHLFIPALSLGLTTSGALHPAGLEAGKTLRALRFADAEKLARCRCTLRFLKKSVRALTDEAVGEMAAAKAAHDRLEAVYAPTMDFAAVSEKARRTAREFLAAADAV